MRNIRRVNSCQWVVGSALVLACGWLHAGSVISHPYRGVTQIVRTETSPRSEHINVMQIDLTTPGIRFLVSNGNTPVNGTNCEVTTAKTLDYMTAQNGQIAINAHFFQAFSAGDPVTNKWVVGLAASQGYVYSSFEGPTPATSNPVGSLTLTQDYAIMTNAPALNIDAQNNAQVVHYDASFADKKHVLEPVTLYNALCGSAQIVTNGAKSIPTYTGNAATGLISNGTYSDSNSWYNAVNARTAIGLSSDNHTLTLFTIDNAGGSNGMSVGEVADMLRTDYQVWNALNLDGGGSTTMAFQDPVSKVRSVINSSSNGATPRIVATSLVVFAEPRIAVEQPAGTGLTNNSGTTNFGSVSLGSTSAPITFTVKNSGAADLTGLAVTRDGTNAADYTITTQPAALVAAAGSTTFTVTFKPAATGTRTAVLHIVSNDATQNPFNINLTGAGTVPAIAVEQPAGAPLGSGTSTVDFGSALTGTAMPLVFTIRNTGTATLSNIVATADGTNAAEYTITAQPDSSVPPSGSTTFTVTFKPTATGTRTAVLHVASNDPTWNPFNVNLTGAGTAPAIAVEQPPGIPLGSGTSTVDFGSALSGTAVPVTFTIRNTGTATLSGIAVTADGTNAADYTVTAQPLASLPAAGSTTFTVTFKPVATGTRTAVLHIASNDATWNPFNINLTGSGTAPAIAVEQPAGAPLGSGTSTVDFGSALTGTAMPLVFTIRNTGTATLSNIVATADGTNAADYTITAQPAASLPAAGSTTVTVTFKPAATGTRTAVLHVASNDPTWNPFNVNLTGSGTAPAIAVEQPAGAPLGSGTSTVDFGSALSGTAVPVTFTIRNTGTATLSGIAVTADGTNAAEYTITAQPAASLPAAGSTTFTVTFKPVATGTRTAVLHIASNDATWNPFNINLTGAGAASTAGGFSSWAVSMGLGADADPMAAPTGDGVSNLLKFAFNMDPAKADTRCLTVGSGQTAGLPGINLIGGPMMQMEFIRRKASTNPGITYTAQFGSDLTVWDDYPDPIIPVSIDETWERITVPDFSSFAPRFARVVVSLP